jgi:hypothetical protein
VPGSGETTRRLVSLPVRSPAPLLLAVEAVAEVTALHLHAPFRRSCGSTAESRGLGDTIRGVNVDIGELAYSDGSFDLVRAESSVHLIGADHALPSRRRLIAPPGSPRG